MEDRTADRIRDGALALVALGWLLDRLRRRSRLDALLVPGVAFAGVVGAVGIEAVLLRRPERTRDVWERPPVRTASLLGAVLAGRVLSRRSARSVAALCWGLLAYLAMLGSVLAGRSNPVAVLVGGGAGDGRSGGQS